MTDLYNHPVKLTIFDSVLSRTVEANDIAAITHVSSPAVLHSPHRCVVTLKNGETINVGPPDYLGVLRLKIRSLERSSSAPKITFDD